MARRIGFKRVLLAADFSDSSLRALPYAAALASQYEGKLYIAHVIETESHIFAPPGGLPRLIAHESESAGQQLKSLAQSELAAGVPVETLVGEGPIADTLFRMAEQHQIDLLAAGTHGRRGLKRLLLGSVAEELIRTSPCPVLTVGPHARSGSAGLKRILFATDFSPEAARALTYALSLAQEFQSTLVLTHVTGTSSSPPESLRERMRSLVPAEAELWCEPEFVVLSGSPGEAVVEAAAELGADLIVMGARDPGEALESSTTHLAGTTGLVASGAICPVLSVRGTFAAARFGALRAG